MKISATCIQRPVFTIVMSLLFIVVGLVGYSRLEMRDLPRMEVPAVGIVTSYAGASAEVIETQVTKPLEDALASLEGLDVMTSDSSDGQSKISIQFKPNYDVEAGMNHIRDKVNLVSSHFPEGVDAPVLQKVDLNANPVVYVSFMDDKHSKMALTDYVSRFIKPVVEQIEGVGTVQLWGARSYAVRIWPQIAKMASRGINIQDISEILKRQNVSIPGGVIESRMRDYTVVPATRIQSIDELKNLIIKNTGNQVVRLQDVVTLEIAPEDDRVFVHSNGKPSLVMAITPQSIANPIDVSNGLSQYLSTLTELPQGMSFHIIYDRAVAIKASIRNVYHTLIEAVILVVIVIFGFLGSLRGTLIPITTIPICLLGIFYFLYMIGFSINNMTLLALVLAIGLVVDDAIVMLENVHRHIEQGQKAMQAAFTATQEIGFAILAMTMTLVAVYLPVGFQQGTTGQVFKEFAFTLAGTVLISGFIALTLSPMMCARFLPDDHVVGRYSEWLDQFFDNMKAGYQGILRKALTHPKKVGLMLSILVVLGGFQMNHLSSELTPTEDIGGFMTFMLAPSAASRAYLQEQMSQVEHIFQTTKELNAYVAVGGVPANNNGLAFMNLLPWNKRDRSQNEIMGEIQQRFNQIIGARVMAIPPQSLPLPGNDAIDFVVQMAGSYEELNQVMTKFKQALEKDPILSQVRVHLDMDTPQLRLSILRDVAADQNVNVGDIMDTISIMMGGRKITEFESGAENYDVIVQLDKSLRKNPDQINALYVRNRAGRMIALSSLVRIEQKVGAQSLSHFNRMRAAELTASLAPGVKQGDAVKYVESVASRELGDKVKTAWTGQTREYLNASGAMYFTMALAIVFIYLVLAAQFESFRDPLIIMLTVPFSIVGAIITLRLTGGTSNMYTQIGFVTLIGLVTKHGILITEFANQLLAQGHSLQESIIQSAATRLRPILMTTAAMILGAVPLAIATGAGAQARTQLGWTIIGGMGVGTIFSLLVVPLAYTIIKRHLTK